MKYEVLFEIETDAADDNLRDAVNAAWYVIEEALGVEPVATARTVDVDGKIDYVEWDDWDGDGTSFSVRRDS